MKELDPGTRMPSASRRISRAGREGLTLNQLRILKALTLINAAGGATKERICELVEEEFPTAAKWTEWTGDAIGPIDPTLRPAAEKRTGYPGLLTLEFISTVLLDVDGKSTRVYRITPDGRKAYNKAMETLGGSIPSRS